MWTPSPDPFDTYPILLVRSADESLAQNPGILTWLTQNHVSGNTKAEKSASLFMARGASPLPFINPRIGFEQNGIHFCDTTKRASQRLTPQKKGEIPKSITEVVEKTPSDSTTLVFSKRLRGLRWNDASQPSNLWKPQSLGDPRLGVPSASRLKSGEKGPRQVRFLEAFSRGRVPLMQAATNMLCIVALCVYIYIYILLWFCLL